MDATVKRLYIIGNGFDCAHALPTTYCNFKKYVKLRDKEVYRFINRLPNIGIEWQNFEDSLGGISFKKFRKIVRTSTEDKDKLLDRYHTRIQILLEDWINSIAISCEKLLDISVSNSLFLTFNYTKTLEEVYSIPEDRIFHIHGVKSDPENVHRQYVFGHSVSDADINNTPGRNNTGESSSFYVGVKRFNKSCDQQIQLSDFKSILDFYLQADEVIVFGHSLGKADQAYFDEFRNAKSVAKWIYYEYKANNILRRYKYYRRVKRVGIPMEIRDSVELKLNKS